MGCNFCRCPMDTHYSLEERKRRLRTEAEACRTFVLWLNTCKAKVDWSNYHAQQPLHLVLAACKASICFHVLKDIKLILSKLCLGMHKKIHTPYKMERTEYITYYYATINKCHKYLVLHISWSQKKTHTVQYLIFHGNCSNKEDSHRFWAFIYMLPLKPT